MILDITRIRVGPQMGILKLFFFSYITYAVYSRYNTVWIANTDIGMASKNSVIVKCLKWKTRRV